jgi:hypothetical protein
LLRGPHWWFVALAFLLPLTAHAQSARDLAERAVNSELAADRNDHSRWIYFERDNKPGNTVSEWVADTGYGSLHRIVKKDGQPISATEQRRRMESFVRDSSAQARQRKAGQHDDQQAEEMLRLLPRAFLWTRAGAAGPNTVLHFAPNPQFRAPDWASRVFAAMEGDMVVNTRQNRIVSLRGRMIYDVRFASGLLGELKAGGTFQVERRELDKGVWQIVATHVHIYGHALLFKTISEEEDDEKQNFVRLPGEITLQQAEAQLLAEKD